MPCRNPVNVDTCPYCDYHVGSEFKKVQSKRGQFAESKLHSAFKQQGGKGLSGVCSLKQPASRAAKGQAGDVSPAACSAAPAVAPPAAAGNHANPCFKLLLRHLNNLAVVSHNAPI